MKVVSYVSSFYSSEGSGEADVPFNGGKQTGDEEYNPLAQYDDLDAEKQAEIKIKQVVRLFICCTVVYDD